MASEQWFVILWQEEFEKMKTPAQLAVYSAIKSYTANGRRKIDLSFRDIHKRCKFSISWMKPVIQELIGLGLVFTHGTLGRRGGECQVFSIGTLKNTDNKSSVPLRKLSVPPVGTKCIQSNKVNSITTRSADRAKKSSKETDPTFGVISKSLLSYMFEKTGVKQILIPKQMAAIKHITNAGYSEEDVRWAIDQLLRNSYWREKGFDFMTVAGQLPKLKMAKPKTLEEQGYKHYKAKGGGGK